MRQKILYVIATLDPAGAENQLVQLAANLNRRQFEPTVCCLTRGGPLERELHHASVPCYILHKSFKLDFSVILRLVSLIRQIKPDIIHTWLFTANSFGRAAAIVAGTPFIISSERCVDRWKSPLHRFIDRLLSLRTNKIIVNAEAVKRFYVESEGLSPEKIVVIRNGIDLSKFTLHSASKHPANYGGQVQQGEPQRDEPNRHVKYTEPLSLRRQLEIPTSTLIVGSIGRLEPQKGFQYLLHAAQIVKRRFENAILIIVGGGKEMDNLRHLASKLGISSDIKFLGSYDHRDIPAILSIMDVFVLPSLWEGFPNVILEAMASGKPVVATDVGGTAEIIEDGKTGFIVPSKDAQALADKINTLLSTPALRKQIGIAGRKVVERDYALSRMIEMTESIYRMLDADK